MSIVPRFVIYGTAGKEISKLKSSCTLFLVALNTLYCDAFYR